MSQGVILIENLENESSVRLKTHPFGRNFKSSCPVCKYMITPYNSGRYCHCEVYAHGGCILYSLEDISVDVPQHCQVCKAPYNLSFSSRFTLRPLSHYNFIKVFLLLLWASMIAGVCLLLIELINHSIQNDSLMEQLSYFLFSTYMALFIFATLGCCCKITLYRASVATGIEPYYRTIILVEQELHSEKNSHVELSDPINDTEAFTAKDLQIREIQ